MTALAEQVDFVIGVDTHKNSHTAAVGAGGGLQNHLTVATDAFGYKRLLSFARDRDLVDGSGQLKAPEALAPA